MLAHELGHTLGYADNVSSMDMIGKDVRFAENPIRGEFELPLRISYHIPGLFRRPGLRLLRNECEHHFTDSHAIENSDHE